MPRTKKVSKVKKIEPIVETPEVVVEVKEQIALLTLDYPSDYLNNLAGKINEIIAHLYA